MNNTRIWNGVQLKIAALNGKWVLKSVLFSIPVIAALFFSTPLSSLFISNGKLTWIGIMVVIASILIIPLQFLTSFVANNDVSDVESYLGEIQIRKKVADTQAAFEEDKNRLLRNSYRSIAYDKGDLFDFTKHHINPAERTSQILSQVSICFADVCDMAASDVVLSAMVSCDNDEWDWLCDPKYEGCADKEKLLNEKSALKKVIDGGVYYFNNSKEDAIKAENYVPDQRDNANKNEGSIICWEVAAKIKSPKKKSKEVHTFRMIISISTYGRKLIIDEEDKDKIERIYRDVFLNMIMEQYQGELCENLLWYGFQYLNEKKG